MKLLKKLKMPAGVDASYATTDALEPEAGGGGEQGEDGNGLNHISDDELIAEIKSRGLSMEDKPAPLKNRNAEMENKSEKVSAK